MRITKSLAVSLSTLAIGSAIAADPAAVPPVAPHESGQVHNLPHWTPRAAARDVEGFFVRYDTNRDAVISWEEAQQDPELARVFARADTNGDGVLDRNEFQNATLLAVNTRQRGAGAGG